MSANANREQLVVTGMKGDKYEHLWKIEGFTMMDKKGSQLESTKFEINTGRNSALQSKWQVGLKNNNTESHYFVYCKLLEIFSANGCNELPIQFTIELKRTNGSSEWTSSIRGNVKLGERIVMLRNDWWNESTDWQGFLDDSGSLTLAITLTILEPFTRPVEQQLQTKSIGMMKRNLEALLDSVDTELVVKIVCSDGQEFKCHSSILKSNSSVFKSMLESGLSETQTGVVNVSDLSGATMEILIRYFYTGELLPTWNEPEIILEFTYAAGKYQLMELLEYLDNMLGRIEDKAYSRSVLLSLLDLARKLSLKKAETYLKDCVAKLTISSIASGGDGESDVSEKSASSNLQGEEPSFGTEWQIPGIEVMIKETHPEANLRGKTGIFRNVLKSTCAVFLVQEERTAIVQWDQVTPTVPQIGDRVKVIGACPPNNVGILQSVGGGIAYVNVDGSEERSKMFVLKFVAKLVE